MDIKANMLERIARAKFLGNVTLQKMLEERLEQLERPVSAQPLFQSAPIVNRKNDHGQAYLERVRWVGREDIIQDLIHNRCKSEKETTQEKAREETQ